MDLHLTQIGIKSRVSTRAALRHAVSIVLGFVVCLPTIAIPLAFSTLTSIDLNDPMFQIWLGVAAVFGGLVWRFVIKVLDYKDPYYLAPLAKFVFGAYRSELDEMGGEVDLVYFINDPTIRTVLTLRFGMEKGRLLFWENREVLDILPLTIDNAAVPNHHGIWIRTQQGTALIGPGYLSTNMANFKIIDRDGRQIPYSEWEIDQRVFVDQYLLLVCENIYFGLRVQNETFYKGVP